MKKFLVVWSLVMVVASSVKGGSKSEFGNILDVSWRIPEPHGPPESDCERDIQAMYSNLRNMTLWAYEMWDASGRAPTGLMQGNRANFGNIDECIGEEIPEDGSRGLQRQYCTVYTYLESFPHTEYPEDVQPLNSAFNQLYMKNHDDTQNGSLAIWGVCAPASCNYTELRELLQDHFHNESLRIHAATQDLETVPESDGTVRHEVQARIMSEYLCQTKGMLYSFVFGPGTISFIIICGLAVTSVVVATSFHWYMRRKTNGEYKCSDMVKAFSLIVNIKKMCHHNEADELKVFNGLRVLSILPILVYHRASAALFISPVLDYKSAIKVKNSLLFSPVDIADYCVDNFFMLSGALVTYRMLLWKPGAPIKYHLVIFDRYIRLFPLYLMTIMYTANVLPLLGDGPLWIVFAGAEAFKCKVYFWTNLLMINNYVETDHLCIGQTWYLSTDFQLFLVSLSVIWLLRSKPKAGLIYLGVLMLASALVTAIIMYYKKYPAYVSVSDMYRDNAIAIDYTKLLYYPSHARAGSSLLGVVTGFLLVKYHKSGNKVLSMKTSILTAIAAILWIIGMAIARHFAHRLPIEDYPWSPILYVTIHRLLWISAICTIVLCCTLGDVPLVSAFLGWSFWAPLSRLVYGVFLLHLEIQFLNLATSKSGYHFHIFKFVGEIAGDLFYSFLATIVLHLFIEAPFRGIVQKLMSGSRKKPKDQINGNKPDMDLSQITTVSLSKIQPE